MADMGTDFNGLVDAGALTGEEVVPLQRGTGADSTLRTTIAKILAAAGSGAKTGDTIISANNPGAGWLRLGTVYSQSAYPALYGLVGLIGDAPPGRNWAAQTPTAGITTLTNDACWITGKTGVAVGNNVIWRTTDAGASWSQITVAGNLSAVCRVSDTVVIAVGMGGVILRSTDSGATWVAVSSGTTNALRVIVVFSASRIYVAGDTSTARLSANGGASFAAGVAGIATSSRAVRFSSNVAVIFSGAGTVAARTTDGGATWANVTIPSFATPRNGVAFNSSTAIIGTNNGATLRTVDAGLSWALTTLAGITISFAGFVATGEGSAVFIANNGTSYFTFDYGANMTAITTPLTGATAGFSVPDIQTVAVGNGVQFGSMAEFGYDSATQFKTPKIDGIGQSLAGFIKS